MFTYIIKLKHGYVVIICRERDLDNDKPHESIFLISWILLMNILVHEHVHRLPTIASSKSHRAPFCRQVEGLIHMGISNFVIQSLIQEST